MSTIDVTKTREELGLNQREFADLVGVDRRTVVNWEMGRKIPNSKLLLFEMLLDMNRKPKETNLPGEHKSNSSDLTSEILELKDHIKTLKDFLNEKTITAEFYKNENLKLKEDLDNLRKEFGG